MIRRNPKDELEEEVVAVNTKHKDAIPKHLHVSERTLEDLPVVLGPDIWLELLEETRLSPYLPRLSVEPVHSADVKVVA